MERWEKLNDYATRTGLEERTARRHCQAGRVVAEKRRGQWYVRASDDRGGGPPVTITIRCRSFSEAAQLLGDLKC
jgi:hypothetical protein